MRVVVALVLRFNQCQLHVAVVHPDLSHGFATRHDSRVWSTLTRLLGVEGSECARQRASLPFSRGGLGLRSAVRTSTAAYWSSWADTLSMIRTRHPTVADDVVIALSANLGGLHLPSTVVDDV